MQIFLSIVVVVYKNKKEAVMIDLSYKRAEARGREPKKDDEPVGILILALMPFAIFFWVILTAAFVGGKFW